jgi:hypothetical protein
MISEFTSGVVQLFSVKTAVRSSAASAVMFAMSASAKWTRAGSAACAAIPPAVSFRYATSASKAAIARS